MSKSVLHCSATPTCNWFIFGDHNKCSTFRGGRKKKWGHYCSSWFLFPPTSVAVEVGPVLCVVFGITESECSGEKKEWKSSSFLHPFSTCMSRACQWMLQMPYKKRFMVSELDTFFFVDWHVSWSTMSAQFGSNLFPDGYLLKCNFNKVHIFPWTLYTAAT